MSDSSLCLQMEGEFSEASGSPWGELCTQFLLCPHKQGFGILLDFKPSEVKAKEKIFHFLCILPVF